MMNILLSILPNSIRILIMRLQGYKVGKKVKLGFGAILNVKGKVYLDDYCCIGALSYIKSDDFYLGSHSKISSFVYINNPKVNIGKDVKISNFVIIRSGHLTNNSQLFLGDLVHIFPFVMIDTSRKVYIDEEAGIGPHCNIFTHSSYKSILQGYPVTYGDVSIGKRVELTYNVFVAPGVTIGDDAICAYGSYVNKDIPEGVMAAGLPAVIKRNKEQIIHNIKIDDNYIKITLEKIINEYRGNIILITNRNPLSIHLCISQDVILDKNNSIYVLYNSKIIKRQIIKYAVFDVSQRRCYNHNLNQIDFEGFRKYLSRYGIRFITGEII